VKFSLKASSYQALKSDLGDICDFFYPYYKLRLEEYI